MHKMWKTAGMPQNSGFLPDCAGLQLFKKPGKHFAGLFILGVSLVGCGLSIISVNKLRETLDGTLRLGWKNDFFIW